MSSPMRNIGNARTTIKPPYLPRKICRPRNSRSKKRSRARLAALINVPLNHPFAFDKNAEKLSTLPTLSTTLTDLETIGIYLRPDLREEVYQNRIDQQEVRKEFLRAVPGLNAFTHGNGDSNLYLENKFWAEMGLRTTLDILNLVTAKKKIKAAKTQVEFSKMRRLASTVAAMVQVNMGYYQYRQSLEMFNNAQRLSEIEEKLLAISQASAKAREVGDLQRIRQSAQTVAAILERNRFMIDGLAAWGNLYFSVGGDILGNVNGDEDLAFLTSQTRESLNEWMRGKLPEMPSFPTSANNINETPILVDGCIVAPIMDKEKELAQVSPVETIAEFTNEPLVVEQNLTMLTLWTREQLTILSNEVIDAVNAYNASILSADNAPINFEELPSANDKNTDPPATVLAEKSLTDEVLTEKATAEKSTSFVTDLSDIDLNTADEMDLVEYTQLFFGKL